MRKHFQEIHEVMAIKLIELIYDKNVNANSFLLFYNGNTVLINNKKYKIPFLSTEDGQQWNNASLIGICNLWMNTKRIKERYEYKLVDTNVKLVELEKTLSYIKPEKEAQEKEIQDADILISKAEKIHNEINAKLKYLESSNLNSSEYFSVLEKYKASEIQVEKVKNKKKKAKANLGAIKDANSSTYSELEILVNQKKQLIDDLRAQDLNINSKNSQINPILRSISKVLMARTKLLKD